ncbi:MAG: InlB B-repeat-containing protein [Prevotella sp.]|nr:InlB B-repeat-containing protein [Prevotella sp.]
MKKLLSLFVLLVAIVTGAQAVDTVFLWQSDGSTTTKETALTATGGTATFYGSANPSTESAAYNEAVTDNDLKATGAKGHKLGTNTLYLKLTLSSGTFKAGDKVYICGYNPFRVGTGVTSNRADTDIAESLATGTAKGDYNVGVVTLPATFEATNTIYISRAEGTGTGVAAVKVTRESSTTAPTITTDLNATAEAMVGVAKNFSIVADGAVSYQWYKASSTTIDEENDKPISGATSSTYAYTATAAGTEYIYCVATNSIGSTTSTVCAVTSTVVTLYSVTYDLNGGTGTVPTEDNQIEGAKFTVAAAPSDLVAPTGKEFVGWNDGSTDYNAGDTYTVGTSNVTLTAVYQDRTYQGLTPTATLDFSNPGSTFASVWYTTEGKLAKDFSYQPTNGIAVMSAYAVYQSVNAEKIAWETFDSGNSSTDTWEATGDFQGSSYYFESDARAASVQAAARIHYYRVAGITGVSALFNGKAGIEVYEVNSGVVTPDPVDENFITSAGTASLSNLDATKEYIIAVRGNNGTSNIRFYEIAFTFPAITTETIEIPAEGVATYVTANAVDFSSVEGFTAYVPTGVNSAKTSVATAEVTTVPAGTAVLLKGTAGSYDVEIVASAEAPAPNLFQVSNGTVTGGDNIFAYSKSALMFKKVNASVTIPAGKCYLVIDGVSGDALDLDFEGEATAVEAIAEANAEAAAPVKVIKNGKLYIGNYNVAGQQVK